MTEKILAKAAKTMKSAWKKDRDHLVRLDKDFLVGRLAESFAYGGKELPVLDWRCADFAIEGRTLTLFARPEPICDGATCAPDKLAGVDIAPGYLPHDYLYEHLDEMAADEAWKAAGWTKESLRAFFDAILGNMVEHEERRRGKRPWRSRLYHAAVRLFGGVAHRLGIAALALAVAGCAIPAAIEPSGEEPQYTVVPRSVVSSPSVESSDPPAQTTNDQQPTNQRPTTNDQTTNEPRIDWRYGGFDGSRAKEDPRCVLALGSITRDRITYKWVKGIPGDWKRGKTSKGTMVVACAFYWDGGKWVGGKMDWTDESRTVRECTHIHGGYNGWKSEGWDSATRRAFCVVSADGKRRSNLIEER